MSNCVHCIDGLAEENAKLRALLKRWIDATDRNEDAIAAWERAGPDSAHKASLSKASVESGDELYACEEAARDAIGMER